MASFRGGKILESLETDYLTCPICLEIFMDPRILPCNHRICYNCLCNLSGGGWRFQCPIDRSVIQVPRRGIHYFEKDFVISGMVDTLNQERHSMMMSMVMCRHHEGEDVMCYCSNCKEDVCQRCITTTHQGHVFSSREEAWLQEINPLVEKASKVAHNMLPYIGEQRFQLKECYDDQVNDYQVHVEKIRLRADMFKKMIDDEERRQLGKLHQVFNEATEPWKRKLDELEDGEQRVWGLTNEIKELQVRDPWCIDRETLKKQKEEIEKIESGDFMKLDMPSTVYSVEVFDEDEISMFGKVRGSFADVFTVSKSQPVQLVFKGNKGKQGFLTVDKIQSGFSTVLGIAVTPGGNLVAVDGRMLKIFYSTADNSEQLGIMTKISVPAHSIGIYKDYIFAASEYSLSTLDKAGTIIDTDDLQISSQKEAIFLEYMACDHQGNIYIGLHPIQVSLVRAGKIYKIFRKTFGQSSFKEWSSGYGTLKAMCCTSKNELIIALFSDNKITIEKNNKGKSLWKFPITPYQESKKCSMICDQQDNILVVDNTSSKVIQLNPKGELVTSIITKDDGIGTVTSIAISKKGKVILSLPNGDILLYGPSTSRALVISDGKEK